MRELSPWQIPAVERRFVCETAENSDFTDVWQIPYNSQFRNACRGQVRGIAASPTPSPPQIRLCVRCGWYSRRTRRCGRRGRSLHVSQTQMNYWCDGDFAPGSVWCISITVRWAGPTTKPDAWGITPFPPELGKLRSTVIDTNLLVLPYRDSIWLDLLTCFGSPQFNFNAVHWAVCIKRAKETKNKLNNSLLVVSEASIIW